MNDTPSDRRDAFSETRTESAFHRTLLAEQRTYSAWVRIGLASSATGFGIARLMAEAEPAWLVRCLAILFLTAVFLLAFSAYRDALSKLRKVPTGGIPLRMLGALKFIAAAMGPYLIA